MPLLRPSQVARLTRLYPFYSGCSRVANSPLVIWLAGSSPERVWSRVPGGEVLASLDDYVGRSAYFVGDLDRKITWILGRLVRKGDTVLDVGANIGLTTLWLSTLVGKCGVVHSFEPNPETAACLRVALERRRATNVRLHALALGAEEDELELRIPPSNAGAASLTRHRGSDEYTAVSVPVRPLSRIAAEERIGAVRLIKIDVEGFEAEVLRGALAALPALRPEAILFELNERTTSEIRDEPVIRILMDCGYGFFSVPKGLVRMHVRRFDPGARAPLVGHDLVASPVGACYESVARALRASR